MEQKKIGVHSTLTPEKSELLTDLTFKVFFEVHFEFVKIIGKKNFGCPLHFNPRKSELLTNLTFKVFFEVYFEIVKIIGEKKFGCPLHFNPRRSELLTDLMFKVLLHGTGLPAGPAPGPAPRARSEKGDFWWFKPARTCNADRQRVKLEGASRRTLRQPRASARALRKG